MAQSLKETGRDEREPGWQSHASKEHSPLHPHPAPGRKRPYHQPVVQMRQQHRVNHPLRVHAARKRRRPGLARLAQGWPVLGLRAPGQLFCWCLSRSVSAPTPGARWSPSAAALRKPVVQWGEVLQGDVRVHGGNQGPFVQGAGGRVWCGRATTGGVD